MSGIVSGQGSGKAILIVLDGFGIGKHSPFNAIENAKMPFYQNLIQHYPHSQILTHGKAVGLPDGVMGNSEVGHMTLGAGRIIFQDLTRISNSIEDRSFFKNTVIRKTLEAPSKNLKQGGKVHLIGLLSDGGVHSHIQHLKALLDFCLELKIPQVCIHPFLDGRDTSPQSGVKFIRDLLTHPAFQKDSPTHTVFGSIMGRYWAMDRDQRWDRVEKAFLALTGQGPAQGSDIVQLMETSYSNGITDEFIEPTVTDPRYAIQSGDSVFFYNYRSDRAREISRALADPQFSHFKKAQLIQLAAFAGMTVYDKTLAIPAAFEPQNIHNIFGEWLEKKSLTQFRVAETEKYAHVTFFFNGGREKPFRGEDRELIASPREVATYDLKPEMSAFAVAEAARAKIETAKYDFVLMNFANADMVGHTGNYEAAVRAMEALDQCLEKVIGAAQKNNYHVLLTADHGNAEEMRDEHGQIHTQHTLNPVPAIWIAPGTAIAPKKDRVPLRDGTLRDMMPTLCKLMALEIPPEVTGTSLIP